MIFFLYIMKLTKKVAINYNYNNNKLKSNQNQQSTNISYRIHNKRNKKNGQLSLVI